MTEILKIIAIMAGIMMILTYTILPVVGCIIYMKRTKEKEIEAQRRYDAEMIARFDNESKKREYEIQKAQTPIHRDIAYDELERIIENVITEIWNNKYLWNYRLRDVRVIPNMPNEIDNFVKEVISSLGSNIMYNLDKYYTHEYFVRKVARRSQILFVEYQRAYRPQTK